MTFLIFIYFALLHLTEDQEANTESISTALHMFVRLLLASLRLNQGTALYDLLFVFHIIQMYTLHPSIVIFL